MKKSAGCGILVKKERQCGIRTPLPYSDSSVKRELYEKPKSAQLMDIARMFRYVFDMFSEDDLCRTRSMDKKIFFSISFFFNWMICKG